MDESWGFFSSINRILRHLLPFTGHRSRKTKERNTKQIFPWTENKEVFCFTSSLSGTRCFDLGRFSIQQKFRFEISEISRANETVHIRCTDPTQATAHLVIVLVIIQKSGTGDNDFVKGKGAFRSDRPKWPVRSKWTTFKAGPEYSGRTKPKWSVPFDVPTEISGIWGWMENPPILRRTKVCRDFDGPSIILARYTR